MHQSKYSSAFWLIVRIEESYKLVRWWLPRDWECEHWAGRLVFLERNESRFPIWFLWWFLWWWWYFFFFCFFAVFYQAKDRHCRESVDNGRRSIDFFIIIIIIISIIDFFFFFFSRLWAYNSDRVSLEEKRPALFVAWLSSRASFFDERLSSVLLFEEFTLVPYNLVSVVDLAFFYYFPVDGREYKDVSWRASSREIDFLVNFSSKVRQ